MEKLLVLVVGLILIVVSCYDSKKDKSERAQMEHAVSAEKNWTRIKSEPSHNLSGVSRNHLINHSIEIRNSPETINYNSEGFSGDLLFGDGSLKIINSSVDLTSKYSIRFTDHMGTINLEKANLSSSLIENAEITLGDNSNLYLYSDNPLYGSVLVIEGDSITLYFHGLDFSEVNQQIIRSGLMSISGNRINCVDDFNTYQLWKIGMNTFNGGTALSIQKNK